MINLMNMPVINGFFGLFDYHGWNIKKKKWINQLNEDFFFVASPDDPLMDETYPPRILNEALFSGGARFTNQDGKRMLLGYIQGNKKIQLKNFTGYILFKNLDTIRLDNFTTSDSNTALILSFFNEATNKYTNASISTIDWKIRLEINRFKDDWVSIVSNVRPEEYSLVTVTIDNENKKLAFYVNGDKIGESENIDFSDYIFNVYSGLPCWKEPVIGVIRSNNAGPFYYKCICLSNECHSESDVYRNADWLLSQYGLKESSIPLSQETDNMAVAKTLIRQRTTQDFIFKGMSALKKGAEDRAKAEEEAEEDPDKLPDTPKEIIEEGIIPIPEDEPVIIIQNPEDGTQENAYYGTCFGTIYYSDGTQDHIQPHPFIEQIILARSGSLFIPDIMGIREGFGILIGDTIVAYNSYRSIGPSSWSHFDRAATWNSAAQSRLEITQDGIVVWVRITVYISDWAIRPTFYTFESPSYFRPKNGRKIVRYEMESQL